MASGLLRQILLERNSNYAPPPPPAAAADGKDAPPYRWYRDVELNQPIFHGVLNAWIMSGRGRLAALEAERVLNSMHQFGVEPNVVTYALLTSAWAHAERTEATGDAALRAETILNAMVKQQMRPNAVLFTTVMSAWSMADRNRVAPERAEALLRQLTAIYKQSGNDKAYEPSTEAENAVLSAWARSKRPDAVSRTQRFLSIMSHPDLVTYNTVLDCFANNGKSQEALDLFETMKKHENKALRPDIVSYNSLLNALARAEVPIEEVEKVLHEMEDVMSPVEPDKFSYTCKGAFGIVCCCSW
jgi:pentatricopeptide repeat protein